MKFASTLLMFFGYLLVYAATAASGKFATEPWAGLFADAYTESTDPTVKASPNDAQAKSSPNPIGSAKGLLPRLRRTPGGKLGHPGR